MPSDRAASMNAALQGCRWNEPEKMSKPIKYLCLGLIVAGAAWNSAGAATPEMQWRQVDPENVALLDLPEGRVVIELNPAFAPKTVAQFKRLVESRFYNGLSFYRVIDNFVAQGGDGSDLGELSDSPRIDAEFEIDWSDKLPFTLVQERDLFADQTGFIDGFAAGRDVKAHSVWLTHCPGIVAMARNDDRDSSRTDFYIVIGQAPRYLDRNLNVFGRVLQGMSVVQRIVRGPENNGGVFVDDTTATRIHSLKLMSELPESEREAVFVMDTSSQAFVDLLDQRRKREQAFFKHRPPPVLDVCQVPVGVRLTK
jgi:peptidylprolyl isomerase